MIFVYIMIGIILSTWLGMAFILFGTKFLDDQS